MTEPRVMHHHRFTTRLEQPLRMQSLPAVMNPMQIDAHCFEVTLILDDTPVSPASVTGYAIRPDGAAVTSPGEVSGSTVRWVMPHEALAVPGIVRVLINTLDEGSVTTVLLCGVSVQPGADGPLLDPEQAVPSLEELLAKIADCDAAAEQAASAAQAAQNAAGALSQEVTAARQLSEELLTLLCPRIDETGALVTCRPLPGRAVTVQAAEGTVLHTAGRALWSVSDYTGGGTYYQPTGGQTGNDVALPAGDWVISYRVKTDAPAPTRSYAYYCRVGSTGTTERVYGNTWTGAYHLHLDAPDTVSFWFYYTGDRWDEVNRPPMDVMIADAAMDEIGFEAHQPLPVTDGCVMMPAQRRMLRVWSADGSQVRVTGLEDPVQLLTLLRKETGV